MKLFFRPVLCFYLNKMPLVHFFLSTLITHMSNNWILMKEKKKSDIFRKLISMSVWELVHLDHLGSGVRSPDCHSSLILNCFDFWVIWLVWIEFFLHRFFSLPKNRSSGRFYDRATRAPVYQWAAVQPSLHGTDLFPFFPLLHSKLWGVPLADPVTLPELRLYKLKCSNSFIFFVHSMT